MSTHNYVREMNELSRECVCARESERERARG